MHFRQQGHWDLHEVIDAYVLSAESGPAGGVLADVYVEKAAIVDSDAAPEEGWNLQGEIVHLLQGETDNFDVGGDSARVLAIGDAAGLFVVSGAAVSVMDFDGLADERAETLESVNQAGDDDQFAAAVTGEFRFRKVFAQITHFAPRTRNLRGRLKILIDLTGLRVGQAVSVVTVVLVSFRRWARTSEGQPAGCRR
jgi:hypothetical protein